jgi:hypothetical protein
MRRFAPKQILFVLVTAAFALGWTTTDPPAGDTRTITTGDLVYADQAGTIAVYRAADDEYELVASIETEQAATHDDRDHHRRKHKRGVFSCSCEHVDDHGDHRHDHGVEVIVVEYAVDGSTLAYVDGTSTLVTVDMSRPDEPRETSRKNIGWPIESVDFAQGELVIAGNGGRYALDTTSPGGLRELAGD